MNDQTAHPKDEPLKLTKSELAKRWGVSLHVLRVRRREGLPPHFNRALNGYLLADVIAFEDGGLISKAELAKRWGIGEPAIDKRVEGVTIPPKVMLGGRVKYRLNQIVAMERAGSNTGDA